MIAQPARRSSRVGEREPAAPVAAARGRGDRPCSTGPTCGAAAARPRARAAHLRRGARRGVGDGSGRDRRSRSRAGRGLVRVDVHEPPPAGADRLRVEGALLGRRRRHDLVLRWTASRTRRSATRRSASTSTIRCSRASGAASARPRPDGELEGRIERQIEPQRVVDGTLTAMFAPYSELAIEYGDGPGGRLLVRGRPLRAAGSPQLVGRQLQELRHAALGALADGRGARPALPPARAAAAGGRRRSGRGEPARSRCVSAAPTGDTLPALGLGPRARRSRSTSARRRSSRWRGRGTCASPCACTRRAGPDELAAGLRRLRAGSAPTLELAVSLEDGRRRAARAARGRARRHGRRRGARARARATGRLRAGRAGHRAGVARAGSRRARSRRRRRALRRRQRPVLLGRQSQAARHGRARRGLLRALPAGARRRRRIADGEPALARGRDRDDAPDLPRAPGSSSAPSRSPRASGPTPQASRAPTTRPPTSTCAGTRCSARAGRSARSAGSPASIPTA